MASGTEWVHLLLLLAVAASFYFKEQAGAKGFAVIIGGWKVMLNSWGNELQVHEPRTSSFELRLLGTYTAL